MTRRGRGRAAAGAFLILCGFAAAGRWPGWGAGAAFAAGATAWKESTPGIFLSLPDRTVETQDNGVRGTFRLKPGEGILFERAGRWPVDNGFAVDLEISAGGTNASSKDYAPGDTAFPVAVTLVFGEDSVHRPFKDLLYDFLTGPWYGLFSGGIRLTYAWGHDAPAGSMYRLVEDETVFILAGPDEAGKTIASHRKVVEDFEAAYARRPKGPVTEMIVRVERPSAEKAGLTAGVVFGFGPR